MSERRWLHEHEINLLVMATVIGHGAATEEQAAKVIDWAEGVRIDASFLESVLNGKLVILNTEGPELVFGLPPPVFDKTTGQAGDHVSKGLTEGKRE